MCGRIHVGKCLAGMDAFFVFAKDLQKVRDCPDINAKGWEDKKVTLSDVGDRPPNKNTFYTFQSREYRK